MPENSSEIRNPRLYMYKAIVKNLSHVDVSFPFYVIQFSFPQRFQAKSRFEKLKLKKMHV